MGAEATELSGPDLTHGIDVSELKDGEPLLGHAHGEAAMLVRRGDRFFATGATCTHYGGPLAEGLVVGETIRCPWHHACFDLNSGAVLGAPALNRIPCFEVKRRGDLVLVGPRKTPPRPLLKRGAPKSVIVIGSGAAGAAAVDTMRKAGYAGPLALVGAEDPGPVDRPNLSKDYLAGTAPEEWISLHDVNYYKDLNVEFIANDAAAALDVGAQRITLKSGRTGTYDHLLIATGAEPVRLSIPGADLPHVHTLRTLADSRAIATRAKAGNRVVVIGTSFIGLEVAASLRAREMEVHVVAPEALPLARVMGEQIGRFVTRLHEDKGVHFLLGRKPASIAADAVTLDNGQQLSADLVVMGVGVRPRVNLAEAAGLDCDNGVIVDEFLQTSAPGVFAAGDIARFPYAPAGASARIEHWVHAQRMGQAAARNMLGLKRAFRDIPFFWSAHYDVTLAYVGHASEWDSIDLDGDLEARDASVTYRLAGKVVAVATVGRDRQSLAIEAAMEKGDLAALARELR